MSGLVENILINNSLMLMIVYFDVGSERKIKTRYGCVLSEKPLMDFSI